jgi:hypothetical protein
MLRQQILGSIQWLVCENYAMHTIILDTACQKPRFAPPPVRGIRSTLPLTPTIAEVS